MSKVSSILVSLMLSKIQGKLDVLPIPIPLATTLWILDVP